MYPLSTAVKKCKPSKKLNILNHLAWKPRCALAADLTFHPDPRSSLIIVIRISLSIFYSYKIPNKRLRSRVYFHNRKRAIVPRPSVLRRYSLIIFVTIVMHSKINSTKKHSEGAKYGRLWKENIIHTRYPILLSKSSMSFPCSSPYRLLTIEP